MTSINDSSVPQPAPGGPDKPHHHGSVGSRKYSNLVVTRWSTRWNGADDMAAATVKR